MDASAIFFDVDGTIITDDHRIPPSAINAIHAAQAFGHPCIVNTGRPFSHIEPGVVDVGFDGYICSCGQTVYLHDQQLLHAEISPALSRQVVALVRACKLDVIFEAEHGIYYDHTRPIRTPSIRSSMERSRALGFDTRRSIDDAAFCFDKFCVWPQEDSDLERFMEFVRPHFTVIHRENGLLELVKRGYSKETGIQFVLQALGLDASQCYALGDSTNDLPMLCAVGHSIAMGNAPDEVKSAAGYVTGHILDDGLAKALAHFGLTCASKLMGQTQKSATAKRSPHGTKELL